MPADGLSWAPAAWVMNSFIIRLHQWEAVQASGKRIDAPDTKAQETFSLGKVSGNALVSDHSLALNKTGKVQHGRDLASMALQMMPEAGLALWYPLHLTREMRVTPWQVSLSRGTSGCFDTAVLRGPGSCPMGEFLDFTSWAVSFILPSTHTMTSV